jgi:transposase
MRFVATKTPEQQSCLMLHRTHHLFIRQQTAVINAISAHLAEFGIVAPVGRALAVIRYAKINGTKHRPWLTALLARRPTKVIAIALANKIARMVWAMMARGDFVRTMFSGQPRAFAQQSIAILQAAQSSPGALDHSATLP